MNKLLEILNKNNLRNFNELLRPQFITKHSDVFDLVSPTYMDPADFWGPEYNYVQAFAWHGCRRSMDNHYGKSNIYAVMEKIYALEQIEIFQRNYHQKHQLTDSERRKLQKMFSVYKPDYIIVDEANKLDMPSMLKYRNEVLKKKVYITHKHEQEKCDRKTGCGGITCEQCDNCVLMGRAGGKSDMTDKSEKFKEKKCSKCNSKNTYISYDEGRNGNFRYCESCEYEEWL